MGNSCVIPSYHISLQIIIDSTHYSSGYRVRCVQAQCTQSHTSAVILREVVSVLNTMAGIVAGKVRKARERDLKDGKDDSGNDKGRQLV